MPIEEYISKIHAEYTKQLINLDVKNDKRIFIAFSGVPGSGKSTIAKQLEKKLLAIRINTDDIREVIFGFEKKVDSSEVPGLVEKYLVFLLSFLLKGPNHLIILDASIDRIYKKIEVICKEIGFKLFIIGLQLPKSELIQRINNRNGKDAHLYLNRLDEWIEDNKRFNAKVKVDLEIIQQLPIQIDQIIKSIRNKLILTL